MADALPLTIEMIASTVARHLPRRTVMAVEDRGVWIRHNFKITLDGNQVVYLKVDQAFPASEKEAYICDLLRQNGLPTPRVLALDVTCTLLPAPFIIQEQCSGTSLGRLLPHATEANKEGIYRAMGRFYRQLHAVGHDHSGWIQGAGEVLPFPPADFQYNKVIVEEGDKAVRLGLLSAEHHQWMMSLWAKNLPWLKSHQPSLVTGGAQYWTVYLTRRDDWQVTRLTDLHDLCYWDAAWDLTTIKYPVFGELPAPVLWEAFLSAYGNAPDEKRLKLYRLMRYLDAALGNYMEPSTPENECWKMHTWQTFGALIDEAQRS